MTKQIKTNIGLTIHIQPKQYNYIEASSNKEISYDTFPSQEEYKSDIIEAQDEVINSCIETSLNFLKTVGFEDKESIISTVKDNYNYSKKEQTIKIYPNSNINEINDIKENTPTPIKGVELKSIEKPVVIPDFLKPETEKGFSFESNNIDVEDNSDGIQEGLLSKDYMII